MKIQAIAVAARLRGRGGAHSDEALAVALENAAERGRKAQIDHVVVVGWVDPRNEASKELNRRVRHCVLEGPTGRAFVPHEVP